jgi:hypothetical protein
MVGPTGETSNQIFEVLGEWDHYLRENAPYGRRPRADDKRFPPGGEGVAFRPRC